MDDTVMTWVFWVGVAAFAYGGVSALFRYVMHLRQGARVMAAQALVQAVVSVVCLIALVGYVHPGLLAG